MSHFSEDLLNWYKFSCRYRLRKSDIKFIKHVLKHEGYSEYDWIGLEENMEFKDNILDNEALFKAILEYPYNLPISLELYFYILVRRVLRRNKFTSYKLADYVVSILVQKSRMEEQGNRLYVIDDLRDIAMEGSSEKRFFMRVRLGNRLLFLTSLFEDYLKGRNERRGAPNLEFYEQVGQMQYLGALEDPLAGEFRLADVFETLGNSFGRVRLALSKFQDFSFNLDGDEN